MGKCVKYNNGCYLQFCIQHYLMSTFEMYVFFFWCGGAREDCVCVFFQLRHRCCGKRLALISKKKNLFSIFILFFHFFKTFHFFMLFYFLKFLKFLKLLKF